MTPLPRASRGALALAGLLLSACYEFRLAGTEPEPINPPRLVSVTIEYRQPGCLGGPYCQDKVWFYGSWMQVGTQFTLTRDPGNNVWRGVAYGVPVNYPPHEGNYEPYQVRIYDPHLYESPTEGYTAERLRVGRESLSVIETRSSDAYALVYIDENGLGHNAY